MYNNFINAFLDLDPESTHRLKKLEDQAINIELRPFGITFHCHVAHGKLQLKKGEMKEAQATLRGTPLQMMGVMLEKQHRQRFFADDLVIEGNAEVAQHVIDLLDRLDIDWEEIISHFIGDAPAHHTGRIFRGALGWIKKAGSQLSQDVNEYTHEEAMWFPTREEVGEFFSEVDGLRMDVDRAEVRLHRLAGRGQTPKKRGSDPDEANE